MVPDCEMISLNQPSLLFSSAFLKRNKFSKKNILSLKSVMPFVYGVIGMICSFIREWEEYGYMIITYL